MNDSKEMLSVQLNGDGGYLITGDTLRLANEAIVVTIDGKSQDLRFENNRNEPSSLGKLAGTLQGGETQVSGVTVNPEVFLVVVTAGFPHDGGVALQTATVPVGG